MVRFQGLRRSSVAGAASQKITKNYVQNFTPEVVAKGDAAKPDAPKDGAKEAERRRKALPRRARSVGPATGRTKQIVYKR